MPGRGGKRICLDDPLPPEHENPTSSMTAHSPDSTSSHSSAALIPVHSGADLQGRQQIHRKTIQHLQGIQQQQLQQGWEMRAKSHNPSRAVPNPTLAQIRKTVADHQSKQIKKRNVRRQKASTASTTGNGSSLFDEIYEGHTSSVVQTIADEWIETYRLSKDEARLSLLQFLFDASGCKGKITPEMQATMKVNNIMDQMKEEFDDCKYPLIKPGQQWKKFCNNFCLFFQTLIKHCHHSNISYEPVGKLTNFLTSLSGSRFRAFRHTSTLAALMFITGLVDVAIELENTKCRYVSQLTKSRGKRATEYFETLKSKQQGLAENIKEIKKMLTRIFNSVVVKRYRDIAPDIRAMCLKETAIWMKKYPSYFVCDTYLTAIGYNLYDCVGKVRSACLQALQPLYASEELIGKLDLLHRKFRDRIVAMANDIEFDVAVQAVELNTSILKHYSDVFTDQNCETLYELVYSKHREVAQAAGKFLNKRLFVLDETAISGIKTKGGKQRLPNTPLLCDLVQFFIESELPKHGAYLVDSLIESNEMMKDWECMTDLLLEEPGPQEEPLDDHQKKCLIEIMVYCIRQSATGEIPRGRVGRKQELQQLEGDKERLTDHFMKTLPSLLTKYGEINELINLLSIPQYFDLDHCSCQQVNLDKLLREIQNIFISTEADKVAEVCSVSMLILCTEGSATYTQCDAVRLVLNKCIVDKYKESVYDWEVFQDETNSVIKSLMKVNIFSAHHNLLHYNLWDDIFHNIRVALNNSLSNSRKPLPEEAIKYCIGFCYYSLLWELKTVKGMLQAGSPADDELQLLENHVKGFGKLMRQLLKRSTVHMFKVEAYITLCDLLVVFCDRLGQGSHEALKQLVFKPNKDLYQQLNGFIQEHVFIDENEENVAKHAELETFLERRRFLAGYCKLVIYDMLPIYAAVDIFKNYVMYYVAHGDLIQYILLKAREINDIAWAKSMVKSLTKLFTEMRTDHQKNDSTSEKFISLMELARKFALSFGSDALKNRESITTLHKEGILFAVHQSEEVPKDPSNPPSNLAFLEILSEFSNKLIKQDKLVVLNFLNSQVPEDKSCQHLVMYRNSLAYDEVTEDRADSEDEHTAREKTKPPQKRIQEETHSCSRHHQGKYAEVSRNRNPNPNPEDSCSDEDMFMY